MEEPFQPYKHIVSKFLSYLSLKWNNFLCFIMKVILL